VVCIGNQPIGYDHQAAASHRGPWLLPAATLLLTATTQVPDHFRDPLRERLRALESAARPIGVLFFAATDTFENAVWARFFGRERPAQVINLVALALVPEEHRAAVHAEWLAKIDAALARGEKVWLAEPLNDGTPPSAVDEFLDQLADSFRVAPALPAPAGLRALLRP
jgi:hypothetical protein